MTDPTPAQIKAGNYPKGHRNLHGMRLSIENPTGSIRRGKDPDGNEWASQLTHDYGYIRGAWGRDKDHLDIYLGPDADAADRVFIIDQLQPHTAKFDEHKVMLGFPDADAAREAYLDQFPEGWAGAGGVTEMPLSTFKKWAFQKGRRVKPLSTEVAELTAQAYAGGGSVPEHDKDISTALPEADDAALYALPEQPKGRTAAQRLMILRAADDANAELTRPYIGVRNANKRPEHRNNRAASAEMPFIAARGALATLLGTAGDIEELGRMAINVPRDIENSLRAKGQIPVGDQIFTGVADEPVLLSTAHFRDLLPTGGLDVNGAHGHMAEGLVDTGAAAAGLGALTQLAGALRRGASRIGTRAADAMDSWRDSYIPRKAQVDTIFDRAGNILNPRAALPAYAEGGGVQAINDYSDEQYAAAQQWAQGKTGAEITAKGTELGLSADQFARVLGSPQITGADVAAQGYGTTGGVAAPWMNATYEAPGAFTNPAETLAAGTWQGGTGANATELANAQQWATGKSAAQIAAQAQSMGLTPEQLYQVFGQEQFGAGLGGYGTESGWQRNNMVWDGTRFVEQPTPQVAAPPDSTWTPAQPLPTPPTAPAPEVHAPTGYLQQTVSGSQAWRAGAPGAQTGWTAAPQYAGGGSVSAPTLDFAELKRQYDPYLFDNNDPYWFTPAAGLDTFGWRIGGSDIAGIKRGAAALGMTYQDAVGGGGGEGETNGGTPEQYGGWDALARAENQPQWMRTQLVNTQTGGESGSADSWAEQTLPDLAAIRTHFGLPEDASEADIFRAVNQKYGDLYSITGTRNGWDNADLTNGIEDPRTHVTATFRESDGQLSPLQVGPEFQYKRSSFFEDLAPALGVMAPMLGGMFLGPLGSSISGSLTQAGVPSFLANAAPNILGKGALSALSGGNFLEGAASGLLGSGVNAMGLPVPASSALKIVGNAALKGNDPLKALVNPGNLLALAKP